MQKFFCGNLKQPLEPAQEPPEFGKNRVQQPARGQLPGYAVQRQACRIPRAQVAAADSQRQVQPRPAQGQQKQQIAQEKML